MVIQLTKRMVRFSAEWGPWTAKSLYGVARPKLGKFWRFAKVEMAPPMPREWPLVRRDFNAVMTTLRTKSYRELTVKEAWRYLLVGMEVVFWFFVGEQIGRRNPYGYLCPPDFELD